MTDQTPYQRARKRAVTKFGFYKHFAIYFGVITLLIVINLITSPQYHWYIWPMVGWGVAIAIHAAKAFLPSSEETLIERLTEKKIEKDQSQ